MSNVVIVDGQDIDVARFPRGAAPGARARRYHPGPAPRDGRDPGHRGDQRTLTDAVLCSRHVSAACLVPGFDEASRAASAATLLRLGARLHAALGRRIPLAYGTDPQLDLVYRHRRALAQHFLFLLNEEDVCWPLLDKEGFYGLCEARRRPRAAHAAGPAAIPRACASRSS